jgi:hypothetical protein
MDPATLYEAVLAATGSERRARDAARTRLSAWLARGDRG